METKKNESIRDLFFFPTLVCGVVRFYLSPVLPLPLLLLPPAALSLQEIVTAPSPIAAADPVLPVCSPPLLCHNKLTAPVRSDVSTFVRTSVHPAVGTFERTDVLALECTKLGKCVGTYMRHYV